MMRKTDFIIAGTEKRFGNFCIDTISFLFLVFLHAMVLDVWLEIMPEGGSDWFGVYFFLLYVIYHFVFEYFFGKTLGKFLTKTKVITKEGHRPSLQVLLIRGFARLIPLNPLSFLFSKRGWHDTISNTYVISDTNK